MRSPFQTLFVLAVLLLALDPMTAYADGPVLTTDANGTTTQTLDFHLPPDTRSGVFLMYVRNPLTATIEISAVRAYMQDAASVALPRETISFTNAQDDTPLNGITLEASGARPILMHVGTLPATGIYTGVVSVEVKGAPPGFASLNLHSDPLPTPVVKIAQASDDKKISFPAGTLDFEFPLTLAQLTALSGTTPVTLTLTPLTRQDGSDTTPVLLTLRDAAGDIEGANELAVNLTTNVPRTLTVKGTLPRRAAYNGDLVVQYGDAAETYGLTVTPGTDSIGVREFADGKIAYATGSASWNQSLTLETAEGAPRFPVTSLRVTDLKRHDGQQANDAEIVCVNCDAVHAIGPGDPQTIELRASGLETTEYNAALEIWTQGYTKTFPIALTRTALRDSLGLAEPGTVLGTSLLPLLAPATVDMGVTVSDTNNLTTTIYYPRLEPALQLTDKDGKAVNMTPGMVRLYEQSRTGELAPVTDTETRTTLGSNVPRAFVLRISGLGSGSYKANVSVGGPDVKTVMRTGTIQVKDSALLPLLVLSLGVFLAYRLYHWSQRGRPQVVRAAEIAERREYVLAQLKTADKDAVWEEMLRRLDYLARRNLADETKGTEVKNAFDDVKTRVQLYGDVRIAVGNVDAALSEHPVIPAEAKSAKEGFEMRRTKWLAQAQTVLQGTDNLEDAKKKTETMELMKLAVEIRKSALSWLPKQMAGEMNALTDAGETLKPRVTALQTTLGKILEDLNKVEVTADMAQASVAFKDLHARIEAANVEFAAIQAEYLQGKIAALRQAITVETNLDWRDAAVSLNTADGALEGIGGAASVRERMDLLEQARTNYLKAEKINGELHRTRGEEKVIAEQRETARGFGTAWEQVLRLLLPISESDADKPSSFWQRALQQGDRMVLWIGLALAVLTGMLAQYATPATFGTLTDYVNAFMWGFGVTATTGFAAIAQQYNLLDKKE